MQDFTLSRLFDSLQPTVQHQVHPFLGKGLLHDRRRFWIFLVQQVVIFVE